MKIFDDIELIDLAIYANNTLIVSDFHIGYEEALNKQGLMVPRFQFQEIIKRLNSIFKKLKNKKIERVVVNGDLKHEFGTISDQEWRHTLKLLDYLGQHCKEIILIKGNHDTILGPIANKRNVKVLEHYIIDSIYEKIISNKSIIDNNNQDLIKNKINKKISINSRFNKIVSMKNKKKSIKNKIIDINNRSLKKLKINKKNSLINRSLKNSKLDNNKIDNGILCLHGDKIPHKGLFKGVSTIIIGHEHPAVSIRDGSRSELFKAFLLGKWNKKNLIAQPSFNLVVEGSDVLKEEVLSPFLKGNLRDFKAVIVADKLYDFGKIKNM